MDIRTAGPIYSKFRADLDFRGLLEEFVVSLHNRRSVLQSSFAAGAVTEVARHAHQIKGAAGGYGFDSVSQVAARLENACRTSEPSVDEIGQLLAEVIDHLGRVSV